MMTAYVKFTVPSTGSEILLSSNDSKCKFQVWTVFINSAKNLEKL